jgi:DNA-binding SARP family transcriptional activator/pimeloyl-ACP methyl ester carboxylesterase/predicted ATPase
MEFRVLGPVEAADNGVALPLGGRKQRALLALLLLNADRVVPVERIVDGLWSEDVPETAIKGVQIYVSRLRKILPQDRLQTRAPGYVVKLEPGELDLERFETLFAAGREALAGDRLSDAADAFRRALELWRGPALAEFDEPFAASESARLEELRLTCLEQRIETDLRLGRHLELSGELDSLVTTYPLREGLRAQHLLALYRSGRQAEALAAYQAYRKRLDDELGIEPSQRLRDLERRILQQDPSLDAEAVAPEKATVRLAVPADGAGADTAPIIGREREVSELRALLLQASDGHRRLVFVTGEAGIGKTSLVDAFLRAAPESGNGFVARGQCIEHRGAGEPYLPVLDALGRLGRLEAAREALERFAPTWLVQLPGLVEPGLLEQLHARSAGATRERMLREMVDALDELARERTVVLLLEDLHWADYSTLELLEALARRREAARLLVVATLRPHGDDALAVVRSLTVRKLAVELALQPFDADAVDEYLAARLPGSPPQKELVDRMLELTRGSPLFVEKIVDTWVEEGRVDRGVDGAWQLTAGPDDLLESVPGSLRELFQQRFGELSVEQQDTLAAASVAGVEFSAALVAAALDKPEEEVERVLDGLTQQGGFVEARGEERWPDRTLATRFGFRHDLLQETLYDRLSAGRRARLHARIADRLAGAWGDRTEEIASELASHYVRARDAGHAVRALVLAADHAVGRTAQREAIDHLERALELVGELRDGPEKGAAELAARIRLAPARFAVEGWESPAGERSLVRARELAERLQARDELGTALFLLATMYELRGEYRRSETLLETTLELPQAPAVDSREVLACSLFHQGAFDRALGEAERGANMWDGAISPLTAAYGDDPGLTCHTWAALSMWFLGRPDEARRRVEAAIELARERPTAPGQAVTLGHAAMLAQLQGEPEIALRRAEEAIAVARRGGFALRLAHGRIMRGWATAALGDPVAGIAELEEGLAASRSTGARMDDPYYLGLLADARLRAASGSDALTDLSEALSLVEASRTFFYEPELHRLRGDALLALGRRGDAAAAFERARERARAAGSPPLELRAAVSLARLQFDEGSTPADAARLLREPYSAFPEGVDSDDLRYARSLLEQTPAPTTRSEIRYARSGDLNIAYQVTGDGPIDLVLVPGFVSHLEKDWEEPRHARFLDRLGSFARLIRFDKRGTGLSDRPGGVPHLEERMDDLRAVMDAAGSERAVLFGYSEGGPLSILFAGSHPERVTALVLYGVFAKRLDPDEDYPWAPTPEERADYIDRLVADWGYESNLKNMCPSADDAMARWWGERCRAAASPGAIRTLMEMNSLVDVRAILPSIHAPTLVVHRVDDVDVSVEEGRYVARSIPGAKYVELSGADHFVAVDPDQILDAVEPFVAGCTQPAPEPGDTGRVLATVLMTDIVDSTGALARLGDRAWADLLARHDEIVRSELARFSGELVDSTGDGVLVLFDGPSRAIRCGGAIHARLAALGLAVRVGVHTGEIERRPDGPRGIAVHLAARVLAEAGPGEVLVTATTRDLVAGSGLAFADRGERLLKGFDEPRRLFVVSPA